MPTDERFQNLTDAAKSLIFEMANALPTTVEVMQWYRAEQAIVRGADESVRDRAKSLGINFDGALDAIRSR